jgi:transcription antitermination factor NusG
MDGERPAHVADDIVASLHRRERGGFVQLPQAPPPPLRPGDLVKIVSGPFEKHLALYEGQTAHQHVMILLELLGGRSRVELPGGAIEPLRELGGGENLERCPLCLQ